MRHQLLALACTALLAACGSGDDDKNEDDAVRIRALKVVGDSLSDSGSFGFRFTVQGQSAGKDHQLWVDYLAGLVGVDLCPHWRAVGANNFVAERGCTNFAIGGSRIHDPADASSPQAIGQQLRAARAGFSSDDLLLVGGGSNDVAAAITAFLRPDQGGAFAVLLGHKLDPARVQELLAQGEAAQAGTLYMQALASELAAAIHSQALDAGVQRVVVLNLPAITRTPRLQWVLQGMSNQAEAGRLEAMWDGWVRAFNARLAADLEDGRVLVVDFYEEMQQQIARPGDYGYSNTAEPACPPTASGEYLLGSCAAANLSANPPEGESDPDWWQWRMFADDFHPTPLAHAHMADMVQQAMERHGW